MSWFLNLTIARRTSAVFGSLMAMLMLVTALAAWNVVDISRDLRLLSVEQVEGDWVFTLTGAQPGEVASVRVETQNGYDVDLVGTLVRSTGEAWTLVPFG